jgi:hypothetical protein
VLCEDEGCPHYDTAHICINNHPTGSRVVTVAQLERFARVAAELGDVVVACEIRALIGGQANG